MEKRLNMTENGRAEEREREKKNENKKNYTDLINFCLKSIIH